MPRHGDADGMEPNPNAMIPLRLPAPPLSSNRHANANDHGNGIL